MLPTNIEQIFSLARFQLRDYLRSRRFVLMMGLVVIIGGLVTGIIDYFRPASFLTNSSSFYATLWGSGVTLVIVFAGIIYGGDAIAGEFQNKTGYFLMGLPVRRVTVYVGKYIAAFAAALCAVVLYAGILLANGAYYFGASGFTVVFGVSFILAVVYLLALLGSTFLFSSLFKTSTYATLVVAVLFLFGFMLLADLVSGLAHITPWFIISYSDTIIGGVFNSACMSNPGHQVCTVGRTPSGTPITETFDNATIPGGVAIMIGYFVVTAVVGLLIFQHEEFT